MESVRIKIELLCWGVRGNQIARQVYLRQNPSLHKRTGNAGIQLILPDGLIINAPFGHRFTEHSPYELTKKNSTYILCKNKIDICWCQPVVAPKWYQETTSAGRSAYEVVTQEGNNTLITAINMRCEYFKMKQQCLFCAMTPSKTIIEKSPIEIAEVIALAIKENPSYTVDLTGGNTLSGDRGALSYIEILGAIRKVSDILITVEVSPPVKDEHINMLLDAGANALLMNIEIGDDYLRGIFCPKKSEITKKRYFEAWEYALRIVGRNRVGSALVAGLESKESTLKIAKEMIDTGVIPKIVPFRHNDGARLENFATANPDDVEFISQEVARLLYDKDLRPTEHCGCIGCTGCSAEIDYFNQLVHL
ncbi:MAG: radical SAM protein [Sedimentisphaerales bacterium]